MDAFSCDASSTRGSSPGGSTADGFGRRRRPRCGAKRAEGTFSRLASELEALDERQHEDFVVRHCRQYPELLQLVRAVVTKFMAKKRKEAEESTLRGSVHKLKEVPYRVVRQALSALTDIEEGYFKNIGVETMMWLFYLAMDARGDFSLPSRGLTVTAFIAWTSMRYRQQGPSLEQLDPSLEFVDWEVMVGIYYVVVPGDPAPDFVIKVMGSRKHKKTVELPRHLWFPYEDLGHVWIIEANFSVEAAYLKNELTLETKPIHKLFEEPHQEDGRAAQKRSRGAWGARAGARAKAKQSKQAAAAESKGQGGKAASAAAGAAPAALQDKSVEDNVGQEAAPAAAAPGDVSQHEEDHAGKDAGAAAEAPAGDGVPQLGAITVVDPP